jgi:hypothetical protein
MNVDQHLVGMNLTKFQGLRPATIATLKALGAIKDEEVIPKPSENDTDLLSLTQTA